MRTIEITFNSEGDSKIETLGFVGRTCRDASAFLEEAIGERTETLVKPEFYSQTITSHQQQQSN
ncbi:hypothetical protein Pan97_07410 [Bremerella volcania]|uniref:DUF2997 domain-containing protein n=1 Tax=Bremerella volcania TaxID=2527984 RepID=A0A518C3E1_9BACT|nr:DUF2997 domain-containing protein [Bremerella volcania]QDU73742.1 hypothetical protein Pan97_07410 [Bremerella volcania]